MMKLQQLIEEYIKINKVMQLATTRDGQPWLSTVNYVYDSNLNMYWMSMRSTRHSENIRMDKRSAIAILSDPKVKQCLHAEGESFELSGDDAYLPHDLYGIKYGQKDGRLDEALSGDSGKRTYYVFKPKKFVLFDIINFPDNPRQEYIPED